MGKTGLTSLDEQLYQAATALANAADPTILPLLENYGYGESRLNEGRELFIALQQTIAQQAREYGEKYQATKEMNTLWERANSSYGKTLAIARIALRDDASADQSLALRGKRKRSQSGWAQQAQLFYENIDPTYLPLYFPPKHCAQSSRTRILCLRAISRIGSMSAGQP